MSGDSDRSTASYHGYLSCAIVADNDIVSVPITAKCQVVCQSIVGEPGMNGLFAFADICRSEEQFGGSENLEIGGSHTDDFRLAVFVRIELQSMPNKPSHDAMKEGSLPWKLTVGPVKPTDIESI